MAAVSLLLSGCSSTPEAWIIKGGMTQEEVEAALEKEDLSYETKDNEIEVEDVSYLDQDWSSMGISFNEEGKVDQVSFYSKSASRYTVEEKITEEYGEPTGSMGKLTSWSKDDHWLITFADNEDPFPKALVYWYRDYMKDSEATDDDSSDDEEE